MFFNAESHPLIYIEFFGLTPMYFGMGIKIVTALILGGMIGLDREKKQKAAGVKTNMLICLGACVYTVVSSLFPGEGGDPARIAAQIVSGIGFLGAGAIIQGRGNVIGLTTAATMWVVAALGVVIGVGYPFAATLVTLTILLVLKLLNPLLALFEWRHEHKTYHLEVLSKGRVRRQVRNIVLSECESLHDIYEDVIDEKRDERVLHILFNQHPMKVKDLEGRINQLLQVKQVYTFEATEIEQERIQGTID